jgi:hypothetical protein
VDGVLLGLVDGLSDLSGLALGDFPACDGGFVLPLSILSRGEEFLRCESLGEYADDATARLSADLSALTCVACH